MSRLKRDSMAERQVIDDQKIGECYEIKELLKPDWRENVDKNLKDLIDPEKLLSIEGEDLDRLLVKISGTYGAILKNERITLQARKSVTNRKMETFNLEKEIEEKKEEKSKLKKVKDNLEKEVEKIRKESESKK